MAVSSAVMLEARTESCRAGWAAWLGRSEKEAWTSQALSARFREERVELAAGVEQRAEVAGVRGGVFSAGEPRC